MATDFVIDDGTPERDLVEPAGMSRGLDLTGRPRGYAYGGLADPFPPEMLIPRSDWQGIIEEQEARGTNLKALSTRYSLPIKNQRSTNFCWAFGAVKALEIVRVKHNLVPLVSLSPASVACPINGYRNQGGWGRDAIRRLGSHGAVPSERWADTAINRQYATEENWALALDYRVTEWWELEPGNLDQHISAILRGYPVAVGLAYWSHEVCDIGALWRDGAIAVEFDNSWDVTWGNQGRGIRQGSRILADDAVTPRVAIAA
jgi:hypothetical protein